VSRYKPAGEQVTSQGIQSFIGNTGAVGVQLLQICLGCRSKSKNRDKPINFIVRVIVRFLSCPRLEKILVLNRNNYLVTITGALSSPAYFDKGF